jgi:tyrosine-protein kinase Etk/Wzc
MSAAVPNYDYRRLEATASAMPHLAATQTPVTQLVQEVFAEPVNAEGIAVLVTAPHPGCGVSLLSSCIAKELVARGERVLLVDAHALILLRQCDDCDAALLCECILQEQLWVLGLDQIRTNKMKPEREPRSLGGMIDRLKEVYPCVVIDGPALSASEDSLQLSTSVQGTILVVRAGATEQRQVLDAYQKVIDSGGRVIGSVFNAH